MLLVEQVNPPVVLHDHTTIFETFFFFELKLSELFFRLSSAVLHSKTSVCLTADLQQAKFDLCFEIPHSKALKLP